MVYVFKTTVDTELQVQKLTPYLDKLFPSSKWNFDLEDCDNIFRIESSENILSSIKFLFKVFGFNCEELE